MRKVISLRAVLILMLGLLLAWAASGPQDAMGSHTRSVLGQRLTLHPDRWWRVAGGQRPTGPGAMAALWEPHTSIIDFTPVSAATTTSTTTSVPTGATSGWISVATPLSQSTGDSYT